MTMVWRRVWRTAMLAVMIGVSMVAAQTGLVAIPDSLTVEAAPSYRSEPGVRFSAGIYRMARLETVGRLGEAVDIGLWIDWQPLLVGATVGTHLTFRGTMGGGEAALRGGLGIAFWVYDDNLAGHGRGGSDADAFLYETILSFVRPAARRWVWRIEGGTWVTQQVGGVNRVGSRNVWTSVVGVVGMGLERRFGEIPMGLTARALWVDQIDGDRYPSGDLSLSVGLPLWR